MTKKKLSIQIKILLLILAIIILIISIFIFLILKETKVSLLSLGFSHEVIEIFLKRISQKLVVSLSVTVVFLLVILSFFIKRILSPLFKLSLETRAVVGGDFDYPISIETDDEIGEIAKDFKVLEKSLKGTIRDLRKRNKEIDILLKAATTITTKLDKGEILRLVIEYITSSLGYDYAFINRVLEDETSAIHLFSFDKNIQEAIEDIIEKPISDIRFPLSDFPASELSGGKIVVKKGLKEIMGGVIKTPACDAIQMLLGAKNLIIIPLLIKEKVSYLILILSSKEEITKADLVSLSIFIHYASIALENAQLYEEKREWANELERIVKDRTEELENIHKRLVHQEKMVSLGTMAGRMGHELRNPLAIIKSNVYYLMKKVPPELRRYLEMIERAETRATIVVDETMKFVKGIPHLKNDLCNVNNIIEDALRSLSSEIIKVDVIKELQDNIPAVPLDSYWIHSLLVNIILNAIQAIEGEKGSFYKDAQKLGTIKIKSSFDNNIVEISISDSGPGVPEEIRDKVFEAFFGTKIRGVGLGLAICREIVEKYNGTISISDSEYKGACFTVRFPIEK